jgi:hypothetical protein
MKDSMFYKKAPLDGAFFRKVNNGVVPVFRKSPKLNMTQMAYARPAPYVRPMFK